MSQRGRAEDCIRRIQLSKNLLLENQNRITLISLNNPKMDLNIIERKIVLQKKIQVKN